MKIPAAFLPPPTPAKKRLSVTTPEIPQIKIEKYIAEGSFYKIFKTDKGTILRVSKTKMCNFEEASILKEMRHSFINKMIKWWVEDGNMYFEMESCDFNLKEGKKKIENFFKKVIKKKGGRRIVDGLSLIDENFCDNEKICDKNNNNDKNINNRNINDINNSITVNDTNNNINNENTILNSILSSSELSNITRNDEELCNLLIIPESSPSLNNSIIDPFSEAIVPCSTSIVLSDSEETASNASTKITNFTDTPLWIKIMMLQLSNALAFIHSKRVVHMDIKPENILVKIRGGNITFQLCDFNISRIGEGPFVLDGDKIYMAPEILKNRCFFKSDVYSLGLVYLELVNETALPTTGEEYRKLRKNDFKGWRIDEIGRRMLEKNPRIRCSAKDVEDYFYKNLG